VYLIFGQIRRYKGIKGAIISFKKVSSEGDILLVAGAYKDRDYEKEVRKLCEDKPNIILIPKFIEDSEVQLYFNAADVILFPYLRIFTSGNLFLALSFGKPIVAPAMGCIPELVDKSFALLYDPKSKDGLSEAMLQAKSLDMSKASQAAYRRALDFSWSENAEKTYKVLESLCSR